MTEIKTYAEWNDIIETALHEGIIRVTFEKRDGSERTMLCTLNNSDIPSEKHPTGVRVYNQSVIRRVFDLDKNDWRSINKGKVVKWEIVG